MYGDPLSVLRPPFNRFSFRKLTLGLSSKKPMIINLSELSPSDAAAFATKEFLSVSPRFAANSRTLPMRLNR